MKSVVFLDDLKESDIRPEKIYNEYKELLSQDAAEYFSDSSLLLKVDCPGCTSKESKAGFKKGGFNYRICDRCGSFFVSPRPKDEALRDFYRNSRAGIFLRKKLLTDTLESRSQNIFSYRVQWITGLVEEYAPLAKVFLEYGTRYPVFMKELNNTGIFSTLFSVKTECFDQEKLLPKSVSIPQEKRTFKDEIDVFAAFEIVERVFSPQELFRQAFAACRKGGLFIITSATSSGFEYQVLKEYSPNIIVPDRLNILALEALVDLIKKAGFEVIEVSTPGRLDVEIVKKACENKPDLPIDTLWRYIFNNRDANALHSLQEYLQQFRLSSHVRIAAIKK